MKLGFYTNYLDELLFQKFQRAISHFAL